MARCRHRRQLAHLHRAQNPLSGCCQRQWAFGSIKRPTWCVQEHYYYDCCCNLNGNGENDVTCFGYTLKRAHLFHCVALALAWAISRYLMLGLAIGPNNSNDDLQATIKITSLESFTFEWTIKTRGSFELICMQSWDCKKCYPKLEFWLLTKKFVQAKLAWKETLLLVAPHSLAWNNLNENANSHTLPLASCNRQLLDQSRQQCLLCKSWLHKILDQFTTWNGDQINVSWRRWWCCL